MKNKNNRIIYYSDPIHDDFAVNPTKPYEIDDSFKYIHTNIFFRFFAFVLYHIIAKPILWSILIFKHHVKVYNKKALKQLKGTGYFLYCNHTQNYIDAFINHMCVFHQKGHIIANNDVYSLKGIRTIVNMLGTLPIPNNMIQSKKLYDAIFHYINKKHVVVIFPEAHVWPYYNDIRPFLDTSFIFPVTMNKPIVVTTVVYRQRKILKNHKPYISVYVSSPIFPKLGVPIKENQAYLRDEAYSFMKNTVKEHKSYGGYIHYKQKK